MFFLSTLELGHQSKVQERQQTNKEEEDPQKKVLMWSGYHQRVNQLPTNLHKSSNEMHTCLPLTDMNHAASVCSLGCQTDTWHPVPG